MKTPLDLDALEKLCNEATPGPWLERESRGTYLGVGPREASYSGEPEFDTDVCRIESSDADKAFIMAASTAMPALIAKVRELEGQIKGALKVVFETLAHIEKGPRRDTGDDQ